MFEKELKRGRRFDPERPVRNVQALVSKEAFNVLKIEGIWTNRNVSKVASDLLEEWAKNNANRYNK